MLSADVYWRELLNYAIQRGGYTGCPPPDNSEEASDRLMKELERLGISSADFSKIEGGTSTEEEVFSFLFSFFFVFFSLSR